jgi:hypothetical protein
MTTGFDLRPIEVRIHADTTRFVESLRLAADATRRFTIAFTGDYTRTGTPPYGGMWSRQQLVAR